MAQFTTRRACVAGLGAAAAACASSGAGAAGKPEARPDAIVRGLGAPAIVLMHGLGDDRTVWRRVITPLSALSRTVALNRPGYGATRWDGSARTAERIVEEQEQALRALDVAGPRLLVAHSLGAVYALAAAALRPETVAGLVLVDPTVPGQTRLLRLHAGNLLAVARFAVGLQGRAALAEFDGAEAAEAATEGRPPFAPGPTVVLSASEIPAGLPAPVLAHRRTEMVRLAGGAPNAFRLVEGGHHLQLERPEAVVAAVADALQALRGAESAPQPS